MGFWQIIHAFLYCSWHTGISPLPFSFFCTFFSWKQFHKYPLCYPFYPLPLKAIYFILPLLFILTFLAHSRILLAMSLFLLYLSLFSLISFSVQTPLETSLWYFKFQHLYSNFFIFGSDYCFYLRDSGFLFKTFDFGTTWALLQIMF